MEKKRSKITPEMIQAAQTLFMSMAATDTIRVVVLAYQQKEIDIMMPLNRYDGSLITSPEHDYAMCDEDFRIYFAAIKKHRDAAGLKVNNDDECPLLVAESIQRDAERNMINALYPIIKLSVDDILLNKDGLSLYKEVIDLSLKLLAPFCKKITN